MTDPPIQLPPGFMWCVDIGNGIKRCIPSERLHLTDMSSDGETIKYTLTVGQQEENP